MQGISLFIKPLPIPVPIKQWPRFGWLWTHHFFAWHIKAQVPPDSETSFQVAMENGTCLVDLLEMMIFNSKLLVKTRRYMGPKFVLLLGAYIVKNCLSLASRAAWTNPCLIPFWSFCSLYSPYIYIILYIWVIGYSTQKQHGWICNFRYKLFHFWG